MENLTELVLEGDYDLVWDVLLEGRSFEGRDQDGWTPLHAAALNDAAFLIEPLTRAGCSLVSFNAMGWTSLHIAAGRNNTKFLKRLLEPSLVCVRSGNGYGSTPLDIAATYGNLEAAKMLLSSGVGPKLRDNSGLTAMNYAVSYEDHPAMVQLLADYGAFVDDTRNMLGPPLHSAIEGRHYGAALTLIALGADTTRMTSEGLSFDGLLNAVGWSGIL